MKHCNKCGVSLTGERKNCPLCQKKLLGESDNSISAFPYIPSIKSQFGMFFKLMLFIGFTCAVLAVAVNMTVPQTGWWSLIVVTGIFGLFISITFALNKWSNPTKNIMYQVLIVSIVSLLIDYFTGNYGWSIDYVVPISCVSAMVTMAVISKVMNLDFRDSILYWIMGVFFGILPVIFLITNKTTVIYPSLICISLSLILLAALIIFEGRNVRIELKRRFHI